MSWKRCFGLGVAAFLGGGLTVQAQGVPSGLDNPLLPPGPRAVETRTVLPPGTALPPSRTSPVFGKSYFLCVSASATASTAAALSSFGHIFLNNECDG